MVAYLGQKYLPKFKLIKYKIVVFDEVYILFYFNIILEHKRMSSAKKNLYCSFYELSV
jgi:hypothetical protein